MNRVTHVAAVTAEYIAAVTAEIETMMKDRGYSVAVLAKEAGIPYRTLLRRFRDDGSRSLYVNEYFKIMTVLGVPLTEPFKRVDKHLESMGATLQADRSGNA